MDIESSLEKLFALHTFGVKLGLDNVKRFLNRLNNPQDDLKAIHIAGSNGKGSTAAFIASILMECDFNVGLYTSPHFVKFNERIMINGRQISDKSVAEFIDTHWNYIIEHKLTFFEVTTAMAFQYFNDNNVDYAVIETGLGGRLDATNVLNPLAAVITSINLEHVNILGDKIEQIAKEKAEIIKPGAKVFTGFLPDEADKVIEQKCKIENCELFRLEEYLNESENRVELYTEEIEIDKWEIPLKGSYQKHNAALAALTVTKSLLTDDINCVEFGIKNVVNNTGIQGRYEYYHKNPTVIFDSAHNSSGISKFLTEFKEEKNSYSKCSVLFGVMKDKAVDEMLKLLNDVFDNIYLTQINYERSATIEELKEICDANHIEAGVVADPVKFVKEFITEKNEECLVILGSMYLLGEVKKGLS